MWYINNPLDEDDDKNRKTAKRGLGVQTKAYKEPKRNKDGSKMAPRKAATSSFSNSTGKSLSEALILASTNPKYDKRLFIRLQVQYKKTTCSVQEN